LKLSQRAPLNNYIQPACLPTTKSFNYPPANVDSWAVGWGNINIKILDLNYLFCLVLIV
jgi:hypothetical protein